MSFGAFFSFFFFFFYWGFNGFLMPNGDDTFSFYTRLWLTFLSRKMSKIPSLQSWVITVQSHFYILIKTLPSVLCCSLVHLINSLIRYMSLLHFSFLYWKLISALRLHFCIQTTLYSIGFEDFPVLCSEFSFYLAAVTITSYLCDFLLLKKHLIQAI